MKYSIPKVNYEKLKKEINKLNKRANKLNCKPITFEEIETYKEEIKQGRGKFYIEYVIVNIEGESPKLENWEFIAVLQHDYDTGTVIRNVSNEELPTKYLNVDGKCEHCNINRFRKKTYIVKNTITNEYKQAGKTCLKDYTGHTDIEQLVSYSEILVELQNDIEEMTFIYNIPSNNKCFNIEEYLQYVVAIIDKKGYTSKGKALELGIEPTCNIAIEGMFEDKEKIKIKEENKKQVNKALEWIKNKEVESLGEYWHNLKVICSNTYIGFKDIGFVASLIPMYQRELEKKIEHKEVIKNSKHIGTIGARQDFILTVTKIIKIDTMYGLMNIYLFEDKDGNVFKWATSKNELSEEKTYKLKGTIKDFEVYNKVNQTVITRCKVIEGN